MSTRITASLIAAALALTVTEAEAAAKETSSANFVTPACWHYLNSSNIESFKQGYCLGLVEGLAYVAKIECVPDGVTLRQTVLVVVTYIAARPARMHENFKDLALEALRAAWPCRK